MATQKDIMHDLLLIITTAIFILFATGLSPSINGKAPLVIPV